MKLRKGLLTALFHPLYTPTHATVTNTRYWGNGAAIIQLVTDLWIVTNKYKYKYVNSLQPTHQQMWKEKFVQLKFYDECKIYSICNWFNVLKEYFKKCFKHSKFTNDDDEVNFRNLISPDSSLQSSKWGRIHCSNPLVLHEENGKSAARRYCYQLFRIASSPTQPSLDCLHNRP